MELHPGQNFHQINTHPLPQWVDPENRVIIASGPLGGTAIPGSSTISVVTKGALTNGATSVQANGRFGAFLKFSGYDGLIIQGAAKRWLYLAIRNGHSELVDANHLLGVDTYDLGSVISKEQNVKETTVSVASIGPAGEHLVRFAGVFVDKGHSASHNGPGAVLGAKRLKAIAAFRGESEDIREPRNEFTNADSMAWFVFRTLCFSIARP